MRAPLSANCACQPYADGCAIAMLPTTRANWLLTTEFILNWGDWNFLRPIIPPIWSKMAKSRNGRVPQLQTGSHYATPRARRYVGSLIRPFVFSPLKQCILAMTDIPLLPSLRFYASCNNTSGQKFGILIFFPLILWLPTSQTRIQIGRKQHQIPQPVSIPIFFSLFFAEKCARSNRSRWSPICEPIAHHLISARILSTDTPHTCKGNIATFLPTYYNSLSP